MSFGISVRKDDAMATKKGGSKATGTTKRGTKKKGAKKATGTTKKGTKKR